MGFGIFHKHFYQFRVPEIFIFSHRCPLLCRNIRPEDINIFTIARPMNFCQIH